MDLQSVPELVDSLVLELAVQLELVLEIWLGSLLEQE